ncbi:MAG: 16S rRNA (guanine(966)-N(2))-methyltransferase RsmD [Polyangiales bacterium]
MRVIAGALRGRALRAPTGTDTRPTSDRVRESLFSVLGDLHGARVLDLFAGTGALAIEAISRGAVHAVCVESSRHCLPVLRANVTSLALDAQVLIVARKVGECGKTIAKHAPFNLVFADPPWAMVSSGELSRELRPLIADEAYFEVDCRFVIEHAARDAAPKVDGLVEGETRRWGDTAVTFFSRAHREEA